MEIVVWTLFGIFAVGLALFIRTALKMGLHDEEEL